ncbi:MAG: hypothetical protein ABIN08_07785 [Caldimonas sp.]
MAPVVVDSANVVELVDEAAFDDRLSRYHHQRHEVDLPAEDEAQAGFKARMMDVRTDRHF